MVGAMNADPSIDLLSLADAADLLGRSQATLSNQVRLGRLAGIKIGRNWLVTRAEVERYRAETLGRPGKKAVPA